MSKYDKIQREKLSAKGKEIYDKLRKASSGFKKTEGKVGVALDKFYGKVEATAVKEEKKVVKAVKKAEPKAKAKAKPKAKAKKKAEPKTKKPAYKNVNQGRYAKLVAKMSKEEGISYKEAQKKASKQIRDEKDSKRKESKDKFDNLISHLRTKKGFEDGRGLDRTEEDRKHKIGSSKGKNAKRKAREFGRDAQLPAKAFGKRVSKRGNVYYEYRDNRADVKQPQPSEKPRLADGGMIESYDVAAPYGTYAKGGEVTKGSYADRLWDERGYEMPYLERLSHKELRSLYDTEFYAEDTYAKGGKLSSKDKSRLDYLQKREDLDSLTDSENAEYDALVKKYRKTKDYKYAKGGETHTMPDGSTMLNSEHYAKGGKVSKETDYISNRDIVSVTIKKGGKEKTLKGSDILDGIYVSKISNAFGSGAAKRKSSPEPTEAIKGRNNSKGLKFELVKGSEKFDAPYYVSYDVDYKYDRYGGNRSGVYEVSFNTKEDDIVLSGMSSGNKLYLQSRDDKEVSLEVLGDYLSKPFAKKLMDLAKIRFAKENSKAKGGNIGRDGKFLSEEKHEQAYKPKRKKSYKRNKK